MKIKNIISEWTDPADMIQGRNRFGAEMGGGGGKFGGYAGGTKGVTPTYRGSNVTTTTAPTPPASAQTITPTRQSNIPPTTSGPVVTPREPRASDFTGTARRGPVVTPREPRASDFKGDRNMGRREPTMEPTSGTATTPKKDAYGRTEPTGDIATRSAQAKPKIEIKPGETPKQAIDRARQEQSATQSNVPPTTSGPVFTPGAPRTGDFKGNRNLGRREPTMEPTAPSSTATTQPSMTATRPSSARTRADAAPSSGTGRKVAAGAAALAIPAAIMYAAKDVPTIEPIKKPEEKPADKPTPVTVQPEVWPRPPEKKPEVTNRKAQPNPNPVVPAPAKPEVTSQTVPQPTTKSDTGDAAKELIRLAQLGGLETGHGDAKPIQRTRFQDPASLRAKFAGPAGSSGATNAPSTPTTSPDITLGQTKNAPAGAGSSDSGNKTGGDSGSSSTSSVGSNAGKNVSGNAGSGSSVTGDSYKSSSNQPGAGAGSDSGSKGSGSDSAGSGSSRPGKGPGGDEWVLYNKSKGGQVPNIEGKPLDNEIRFVKESNMDLKELLEIGKLAGLSEAAMADIKGRKHSGSYGSEYQGDDDEDDTAKKDEPKRSRGGQETKATADAKKWQGADDAGSHLIKGKPAGSSKGKAHTISDKAPKSAPADEAEWLRKEEEREKAAKKKSLKDWIETTEEALNESTQLDEKAASKAQQKFMGMVHAAQKGGKPASKEVGKVAKSMGKKDAKDFASTKHKGLPEKVKEEKFTVNGRTVSKFEYDANMKAAGKQPSSPNVTEGERTKAKKDYDGDGKIESGKDEHAGSVDKAIKKTMTKRKIREGINFSEMMKETHMTIDEMLAELQQDIIEYREFGHMSDKLRDALDIHKFNKKITDEAMISGPIVGEEEVAESPFGYVANLAKEHGDKTFELGGKVFNVKEETSTSAISPSTKSPAEVSADWDARVKADTGGTLPAERTGIRGATMPPADSPMPNKRPSIAPSKKVSSFNMGMNDTELAEGKNMKDRQLESWESQLNALMNESVTISTTMDDQGHDSINVSATEENAHEIIELLRNAGIGGLGQKKEAEQQFSNYGVPSDGEQSAEVVAIDSPSVTSGDDMMSLLKKLSGYGSEEGSQDYEEEVDEAYLSEPIVMKNPSDANPDADTDRINSSEPPLNVEVHGGANSPEPSLPATQTTANPNEVDEEKEIQTSVDDKGRIKYMRDPENPSPQKSSVDDKGRLQYKDTDRKQQSSVDDKGRLQFVDNPDDPAPNKSSVDDKGRLQYKDTDRKQQSSTDDKGRLQFKGDTAGSQQSSTDSQGKIRFVKEEECNECGYAMESCSCDHEKEIEESYANSDDDQATQDLEFMTRTISGGLNKEKTQHKHGYRQGDNPMAMRESIMQDLLKLSGIK